MLICKETNSELTSEKEYSKRSVKHCSGTRQPVSLPYNCRDWRDEVLEKGRAGPRTITELDKKCILANEKMATS